MSPRNLFWLVIPAALSVGVLWLSAQDSKNQPEGLQIGELAERVQAREKAASQKEAALAQFEQRLNTLQATLDQEIERLKTKEKTLDEEKTKNDQERTRELERIREQERVREQEQRTREQEQRTREQEQEQARKKIPTEVGDQLIRTYEAMEPNSASLALEELAKTNMDVAVTLLASIAPKKAARILDQLVQSDARLTGILSERVGLRRKEEAK
jgi:flagellar motility protein MotE (MotC chaperone)